MTEDLIHNPDAIGNEVGVEENLGHAEAIDGLGYLAASAEVSLSDVPSNAELRRGMYGDDEAVREIGDTETRAELQNIVTDPGTHTHDELLDVTFRNFSGEAYGDAHWPTVSGGWSTPETATAYGEFRDKYPELAPLSLDPGVMTNLPEFVDKLDKGEITATDYATAREQLKEELGEVTVWRGMTLTKDELAQIKEQGILSSASVGIANSEHPVEEFAATALTVNPSEAVDKHFYNSHPSSPFISVSEHKDVAIAVGRHYGKPEPDKEFYLFQLKMPALDVVQYSDQAVRMPSTLREMTERNPDAGVRIAIDGEKSHVKWSEGVEHFGFWKIDPDNIVDISQPEVTESSWNGKVTRTVAPELT